MLACMNSELQKQYESTNPHDMIVGLRGMFENQARVDRFNTSKSMEKTPYEIWTEKHPSLSFLKIWGCDALLSVQRQQSLSPDLISVSLWDILGKPKDIISTTI